MVKRLILRLPRGMIHNLIALTAFALASGLAVLGAWVAAIVIEQRSAQAVISRIYDQGITWATVETNGLQVILTGTAPDEAARFRLVNLVGSVVDANRIRDQLEITPVKEIEPPRFSVEMLRNDDGIQLIGLLPSEEAATLLMDEARALNGEKGLSDMLETAAYPPSAAWQAAFDYGLLALKLLPRSKISVAEDGVSITAIASSISEQRRLTRELNAARPSGMKLTVDISAPRPVLTPFTLRFVIDAAGARFDACAADTITAEAKIIAAAKAAGAVDPSCVVGLGVPSPSWGDATVSGIAAAAELKAATITFSDADVSLIAASSVSQADFDRVVGELQAALPPLFSLTATLERAADATEDGVAVTAQLALDGRVEIRGRLADDLQRDAVDSFARARFGADDVYVATRQDAGVPDGWPIRVMAGVEALSLLSEGSLIVRPDALSVQGRTGDKGARARISQLLSDKLGQGKTFTVDVTYDEALDPLAAKPTPEACMDQMNALLATRKITFPPASAEVDGETALIMDSLAEILKECDPMQIEIAGHTDSQGAEGSNLALSQARADAVQIALLGRGIDVGGIVAKGYGETMPIADNETEAGREANRRIEFTLLSTQPATAVAEVAPEAAVAEAAPADGELTADTNAVADADAEGGEAAPTASTADIAAAVDAVEGQTGEVVEGEGSGDGDAFATEAAAGDEAAPEAAPETPATDAAATDPAVTDPAVTEPATTGPDFSGDDSPSVAPTEKTLRPVRRPETNG